MKIGILGTGSVGRELSAALAHAGHDIAMGTREPAALPERDAGGEPFSAWLDRHGAVTVASLADAAAHGDIVFNATSGAASLDALRAAGAPNLAGKILVDVANPLDFPRGMPATLTVANTDSLGEQIQRDFPEVRVVKTLNTVNASVMVNPDSVAGGDHDLFVCGNDAQAKRAVTEILRDFGWRTIHDLGDITAARATEMYLPLWLRLMGVTGGTAFNIRVVAR